MLTTTKGWNPWWGKGGGQDSSKTECSTAWAGGRVGGWVGAWAGHCLISQNDRFCHRFLNQSVSPYMAQVHRYSRWVFCTGRDFIGWSFPADATFGPAAGIFDPTTSGAGGKHIESSPQTGGKSQQYSFFFNLGVTCSFCFWGLETIFHLECKFAS